MPRHPQSGGSFQPNADYDITGRWAFTHAPDMPGLADVTTFGAVGDGITDNTASIQETINVAGLSSQVVWFPPGVYAFGSTLSIGGQVTLRGDGAFGVGQPVLEYHGTGTAIAVGNGTAVCYAVEIENLAVRVPNGATAAVAISLRRVSGGIFNYVTIGGGATSGKFTVGWRFEDSGLINMARPIVSNQIGVTGSTAFQFVNSVHGVHNAHVAIVGADVYAQDTVFDLRDSAHLTVRDGWYEGNGTIVLLDQTVCASLDATPDLQVSDLLLDGNTFLLNNAYPNQRVLVGIGAAGKTLELDLIHLTNNRIFLTPSVQYPLKLDLAAATFTAERLPMIVLDGNYVYAVATAVAYADTPNVTLVVGANYLRTVALAVPPIGAGSIRVTGTTPTAFLPPQMTTTERNALPSQVAGMVIYNSSTGKLNVRGAAAWEAVTSA